MCGKRLSEKEREKPFFLYFIFTSETFNPPFTHPINIQGTICMPLITIAYFENTTLMYPGIFNKIDMLLLPPRYVGMKLHVMRLATKWAVELAHGPIV